MTPQNDDRALSLMLKERQTVGVLIGALKKAPNADLLFPDSFKINKSRSINRES
jgi:hypothetical protein